MSGHLGLERVEPQRIGVFLEAGAAEHHRTDFPDMALVGAGDRALFAHGQQQ